MTKKKKSKPAPAPTPAPPFWSVAVDAVRRNPGIAAAAGTAAALAGAALFNRSRANRAEADNPPLGEFVEVDGVRLHYLVRGEGPPVVLLHGNGAMIEDWLASGVIDSLALNYRVIAFDRPGFGHSARPRTTVWTPSAQANLIHAALREIGVVRPIVVGHSWATLVALAMGLDFPKDVEGLVLLSGYYFPSVRGDVPIFSGPAVPLLGDVMRYTVSPVVGRLATPLMTQTIFAPEPVADNFAAFPIEMSLRPSQIRATAADTALMVPAAAELSPRYGELVMPVVIVAGGGDLIAYFDNHSERLHDTVAHSELRRIEGGGHMFHYAAPGAVADAVDQALAMSRPEAPAARGDDIVPPAAEAAF